MAKKKNSALAKPVTISDDLAEIIGKGPMPRTQVTKMIWDYIKKHDRQDPKNRRNIVPDEKLAKVFGTTAPVDMFKMTSLVSKHLS